jgi:hypothetical protein
MLLEKKSFLYKSFQLFYFLLFFIIFIGMGQEQINYNLRRRMWREDGIYYFCRICGTYLREDLFYKSKRTPFKIDTKCKSHYTKREAGDDGEMDYLKLNPIRDEDFEGTQMILERLGYKFGIDCPPIHIQFNQRHNIK